MSFGRQRAKFCIKKEGKRNAATRRFGSRLCTRDIQTSPEQASAIENKFRPERKANKSKPTTRPAKGNKKQQTKVKWKFIVAKETVWKTTRRLFCVVVVVVGVVADAIVSPRKRHPGGGNRRTNQSFPIERKLSEKYTFRMLQP